MIGSEIRVQSRGLTMLRDELKFYGFILVVMAVVLLLRHFGVVQGM
jgi:hypothetical protein